MYRAEKDPCRHIVKSSVDEAQGREVVAAEDLGALLVRYFTEKSVTQGGE